MPLAHHGFVLVPQLSIESQYGVPQTRASTLLNIGKIERHVDVGILRPRFQAGPDFRYLHTADIAARHIATATGNA